MNPSRRWCHWRRLVVGDSPAPLDDLHPRQVVLTSASAFQASDSGRTVYRLRDWEESGFRAEGMKRKPLRVYLIANILMDEIQFAP